MDSPFLKKRASLHNEALFLFQLSAVELNSVF